MRSLRDDLFTHMEALPIKYFDTHAHGDIMSVYTNDVDTLRQLMSQTIPQTINSAITMVATFITMVVLSPILTVISLLTAVIMLFVTSKFTKFSAKYYIKQQRDLGELDGFIEEMMDGQKSSRYSATRKSPRPTSARVNGALCESATKANTFANLLMPVNATSAG